MNDVSDAKQKSYPKCDISDVEIIEKGIESTWSVDDNGDPESHREDSILDAYYDYYICDGCGKDWDINSVQDQEQAFKLVKDHFND